MLVYGIQRRTRPRQRRFRKKPQNKLNMKKILVSSIVFLFLISCKTKIFENDKHELCGYYYDLSTSYFEISNDNIRDKEYSDSLYSIALFYQKKADSLYLEIKKDKINE